MIVHHWWTFEIAGKVIHYMWEPKPVSEPKRLWWVIEGRSGWNTLFREAVTIGQLSEDAIVQLLQRLASRHLDAREILASSIRRSAKARISLLDVSRERTERRAMFWIGHDPEYMVHSCTDAQMRDLDEGLHRRLTASRNRSGVAQSGSASG